jgi:phosphoglycerate dehydrogenase-like enzyme
MLIKINEVVDVCTILEKCSIDEISKYLLNKEKKRFSRYNYKTIIYMRKLNIAIIGLGNIGSYLFKYLK